MDYRDLAQINFGLILEGRRSPLEYNPDDFPAPFNKGVGILQINGSSKEDLAKVMLQTELQDAHYAVAKMNGLGEQGAFDWGKALREAADGARFGRELKKIGDKFEKNEPVDMLPLFGKITTRINGMSNGLIPSNLIDHTKYVPYMPSGYAPIDKIIGGIPTDGPIIGLGQQGVGKSFWMFMIICSWLTIHPDKKAAIYTLEMPAEHYKWRSLKMYPEYTELLASGRLLISGSVKDINELVAEVSASQVGMVGIDDMDGLVSDESPSAYQAVYRKVKEICRFLGIPVIVLAQPNREGKKQKKFLGIYDAAWSGAAENSAAMFVTLNKVDPNDSEWMDTRFPVFSDNKTNTPRLFMCFWKFRENRDDDKQQGVGAIRIEPSPTGYYNQIWKGNAYQNKLHSPNFGNKSNQNTASANSMHGD